MRIILLLIGIFFSIVLFCQRSKELGLKNNEQVSFQLDHGYYQLRTVNADINMQETVSLNYTRNGIILFVLAENILNELFKPEPVVNESGFHYKANPFLEIEETKGNTGFIKFGIKINLGFK